MSQQHIQFWITPNNQLYELGFEPHKSIFHKIPETDFLYDTFTKSDSESVYHLIDRYWTRVTYDIIDKRLSVHSQMNINAVKAIKKLLEKTSLDIQELYLDIEGEKYRKCLTGRAIYDYIDKGRIRRGVFGW